MSIGLHRAKTTPPHHELKADWETVPPARVLDWTMELVAADRACCCSAKPAVAVVLPRSDLDTEPVALLLCGHHYRASREALRARSAEVYDRHGRLITDEQWLVA